VKKMKSKTNASSRHSLEKMNWNQYQLKKSSRIVSKIRIKRNDTCKRLMPKRSLQSDMSVNVLKNPKYNAKFVSDLREKGIIGAESQ